MDGLMMASMRTRSTTSLSKVDKKATPVLHHRPYDAIDGVGLSYARPCSVTCDLAIDRWVNEGGAIREYRPPSAVQMNFR